MNDHSYNNNLYLSVNKVVPTPLCQSNTNIESQLLCTYEYLSQHRQFKGISFFWKYIATTCHDHGCTVRVTHSVVILLEVWLQSYGWLIVSLPYSILKESTIIWLSIMCFFIKLFSKLLGSYKTYFSVTLFSAQKHDYRIFVSLFAHWWDRVWQHLSPYPWGQYLRHFFLLQSCFSVFWFKTCEGHFNYQHRYIYGIYLTPSRNIGVSFQDECGLKVCV